jgi:SAM-dependent methyltransferase
MASSEDWSAYILFDFAFTDFPAGSRVVDLGCGEATQLAELARRGYRATGVDVSLPELARARARGLRVVAGAAEAIPLRAACADGVVCKVVLPYTDEARALAEIGRLLRPDATAFMCAHGAGYYVRYLLLGPTWRRLYAARALVNTWVYVLTGRRLPGFLGDTLYQSRRRLMRHYARTGLTLSRETPAPRFLGLPVFLYHTMTKR